MTSKTRFWLILGTTVGLLVLMIWMGVNWMRSEFTGVVDRSRVVIDEGRALGKYVTANGCVDTVFARHAAAHGADVVFVDNRAEVTEGSTDLGTAFGEVMDLAIARGMARGSEPSRGTDG